MIFSAGCIFPRRFFVPFDGDNMDIYVYILLFLELGFAAFLLWRSDLMRGKRSSAVCISLLFLAFALRASLFTHETGDYTDFLLPWVEFFRENGGIAGLGRSVGNYNPPYLYFLALFSYLDTTPLFPIKLLSVFFDIILAWGVMKLISLFSDSRVKLLAAFFVTLFLPTVVLNGSYWGQCDSIYAAFAVLSLYYGLADKPVKSMLCITASFAFKLQAVFIMPVFVILFIAGKVKLRHAFIFPAAYIVYLLPPVLLGRSLWEVLTVYISQAGTVGDALNYNSQSIFSIIGYYLESEPWSKIAVIAAFTAMLLIFLWALIARRKLDNRLILAFSVLLVIVIPYLLPHMHDRYFFLADVLTVALAFMLPCFFALPVFAQLASLLSYYTYLTWSYLVHPRISGEIMLLALLFSLGSVCYLTKSEKSSSSS